MFNACPTDCPLAACLLGWPVRIDLDRPAEPADRRVPRRCRRCHRYFRPGARGPLPAYCGRKCANAAGQMARDRAAASVRIPAYRPSRSIEGIDNPRPARHSEALTALGIRSEDPESVRGYIVSAGRDIRNYAQTMRRMWAPLVNDPDPETAALARGYARVVVPYLEAAASTAELADPAEPVWE